MSHQNRHRWATSHSTGKLPKGLAPAPSNNGGNYYTGSSSIPTIENLVQAIQGSTGLDLSPTSRYMLTSDLGVQAISTRSLALYSGHSGFNIRENSTAIRGLQVYPGVIDEDYTGEIKIMTQAPGAFVGVSLEKK
jgi:hypothetical protein